MGLEKEIGYLKESFSQINEEEFTHGQKLALTKQRKEKEKLDQLVTQEKPNLEKYRQKYEAALKAKEIEVLGWAIEPGVRNGAITLKIRAYRVMDNQITAYTLKDINILVDALKNHSDLKYQPKHIVGFDTKITKEAEILFLPQDINKLDALVNK